MTSIFPSCLASSALRFHRDAGAWSSLERSDEQELGDGGCRFAPSPVAVKLAEDVLPQTETLRQIAIRYLDIYVDNDSFTLLGEWIVESIEFDLPPLLAPDQFSLCLRHPGDPRGFWRIIFRHLSPHDALLLGEDVTPVAIHREHRPCY